MLVIHRSERADALVAALGDILRHPTGDPFRPEIVAVPSRGVERWLAQQLSHTLGAADGDGVCANVLFPSYTRFLDEAVAGADEQYAESVAAWSADSAVWPLMSVIDECAPTEPWCAALANHLGLHGGTDGPDSGRRYAVAAKLARLYERYGSSRPELIRAWQTGETTDLPTDLEWQAELWRRLRAAIGLASPAELLEQACARLEPGPDFSIFGATRISPARTRILHALSGTRDVHLWLHHPSPALWDAVASSAEQPGPRRAQRPVVTHPLLASMSRDVRELQQLLGAGDRDEHHPIERRTDTLLGRIQDELAHDVVPTDKQPVDDSLQVHAAHGPARQVEVLREVILRLLDDDPTLEPRDIVIMCPDVEVYAPLIGASFGLADEPGAHPAGRLQVRLADRSLRQTNPLLKLLSQLLELAAGRVTATQVLDLASAPPTRRKFGFDEDDLERLRDWAVEAGVRWGLDAPHRGGYGLQDIPQGTWRSALDRVLLGVAMEDDVAWVGGTLPLDDVDSADIELAGGFAELVDRVENVVDQLAARCTVAEWTHRLTDAVQDLGEGDQPWQAMQLRGELDDIADSAQDASAELGLADVSVLLRSRLAGRPTRASFRTGTLTVCTLVPMRSVPHRVVCLLGMDDGVFPRQAIPDGDDILARDPRTGERDARSEDRQLFLDAICAAQEHLVITYTGADPRSGAEVPPCVPLGELLDAIDATAIDARARVVRHHPLQPFDARNFGADTPFSFDPTALAGARAALGKRSPAPPLVRSPLPAADPAATVDLDDLVRFLQHPARGFLRQRLDISTTMRDEDPDDALTIELDGLQGWAIGERVLRTRVAGTPRRTAAHLERLRGELPPGPLGVQALADIGHRIDALLHASEIERQVPADSVEVTVALDDGRTLAGTVNDVRGGTLLTVTYSRLAPRHRLTAWIRYLAVVATTDDPAFRAVTVGRQRDDARRATLVGVTPDLARQLLGLLARIRDTGLRQPLPLALETSAEYAQRRHGGAPPADAVPAARDRWEAYRFGPERDEPEHVLAFGAQTPFTRLTEQPAQHDEPYPGEPTRFGALACLVWAPLLTVETLARP